MEAMMKQTTYLIACATAFFACAGSLPEGLGVHDGRLAACPSSPNCVASDAGDPEHAIQALEFAGDPETAWRAARAALAGLPRTTIVAETNSYLHAESRSALFRFVDDLELQLNPGERTIAVRSASRVGYSDMGVNRERVEDLRSLLGAARP
jgi:uncharacterized protein (DUF1499 family)